MSVSLKKIEHDALELSLQERTFLADRLLSSLNKQTTNEIDADWIDEAERRYLEYKNGTRPGVAASTVFAEADRILKK